MVSYVLVNWHLGLSDFNAVVFAASEHWRVAVITGYRQPQVNKELQKEYFKRQGHWNWQVKGQWDVQAYVFIRDDWLNPLQDYLVVGQVEAEHWVEEVEKGANVQSYSHRLRKSSSYSHNDKRQKGSNNQLEEYIALDGTILLTEEWGQEVCHCDDCDTKSKHTPNKSEQIIRKDLQPWNPNNDTKQGSWNQKQ